MFVKDDELSSWLLELVEELKWENYPNGDEASDGDDSGS